jgi:hypothetical protein
MKKNNKIIIIFIILLIIILLYFLLYKKMIHERFDDVKNIKLIMNEHHSGFFCNFNRLIHYLVLYPNTTEIEFNILARINKHKPFIGDGVELFSQLFEHYKEENSEINEILDIDGNDFKNMPTDKGAYEYYNKNRYRLNPYTKVFKKYIKLKPDLQEMLNIHINILRIDCEQVIGILVRSNSLAKEQPNDKMPTRDDYLNAIDNIDKSKKTKYYLKVDNDEDLEFYKSKLQPNYYLDITRSKDNKGDAPHTNQSAFLPLKDLQDTYLDVAILSNCEYLVHCVSNMSTTSLFMNKNQKSICVSKKKYGLF